MSVFRGSERTRIQRRTPCGAHGRIGAGWPVGRLCLVGLLWISLISAVQAQGAEGLQLGEEPEDSNGLDLGAPAAEPEAPEAPAPPPAAPQAPRAPAVPAPIAGNAAKRVTHGDWEVACLKEEADCAMAQIGNDGTGTPVLEMVLRKLPQPLEADGRTAVAVLDVITPLGVVLTEGLSMKIDKGRDEAAPFQICTEQGCLVREPVDEALINRLRRGSMARITVVAANQGEVVSDLSLKGFTAAYAALK